MPDALFGHADFSERPAPLLGEHTREVLVEYGYTAAEIDELATTGVVAVVAPPTAPD